jgi:metal-responsive CopG/Arc/MetJ family transcriptional regulator
MEKQFAKLKRGPKPLFYKLIAFSVDKNMYTAIREMAEEGNVTVSELIRRMLRKELIEAGKLNF